MHISHVLNCRVFTLHNFGVKPPLRQLGNINEFWLLLTILGGELVCNKKYIND